MKLKNHNRKRILYSSILLIIFSINIFAIPNLLDNSDNFLDDTSRYGNFIDVSTSAQISNITQWLDNSNFTSTSYWYSYEDGTDIDDIDTVIDTTLEQANYTVIGDSYTYSDISGIPTAAGGWTKSINTLYPTEPNQIATLTTEGAYARHYWDEGADQQVAVQWDKEIQMGFNMSDYEVTDTSLSITVNGTADAYHGANGPDYGLGPIWDGQHGVEVSGDDTSDDPDYTTGDQYNIGDFAKFYVSFADQNKNKTYQDVISYQNATLGRDTVGVGYDYMYDHTVEIDDENDLIFVLNNLFHSYNNYNITIIIGIMINCEDNFWSDSDDFEELIIKSCDFSFTYKKKIDQSSYMSWNQDCMKPNDLSAEIVQVTDATLNFKYKVDKNWTQSTSSLNSRIEIEINGNRLGNTILLSEAGTSFSEAKPGGLDVKALIDEDKEINLTIKVFIADEFNLDQNITISIDEVELWISYTITFPDYQTDIELFLDTHNKTFDPSIEVLIGDTVNITSIYKNVTGEIITGADLYLIGESLNESLIPDGDQYNITLDTLDLGFGDKYFKIEASKDLYETQDISFKISVVNRYAYIDDIYLNGTLETEPYSIDNLPSGDSLNINITYIDNSTSNPVENATVQVIENGQVVGNFSEDDTLHFYNYTYNTTGKTKGAYYLTVSASKENYTTSTIQITVVIDAKGTNLFSKLYLNGTVQSEITTTINTSVIIKYSYRDNNDIFINSASPDINGSGISELMSMDGENYTVTIDTNDFSGAINRLDIYASADGYVAQPVTLIIRIVERQTNVILFLNKSSTSIPSNFIVNGGDIIIGDILNITIKYTDQDTGAHIDDATVNITGGVSFSDNLDHDGDQYSIIFYANSSGLLWGLNYLTIEARSNLRESQSFTIQINIISKPTNLELFLNGAQKLMNETIEIELPYGSLLNISARYLVNGTNNDLNNADINLTWRVNSTDYNVGLDKQSNYQNYTLDTTSLGFGRKIIYLSASQTNYQPYYAEIKLYVLQRQVELVPSSGDVINLLTGQNIVITLYLNDTDFDELLPGAEIMYSSVFGSGILTDPDNDGMYVLTLDPAAQGTYPISFSVYIDDNFEFAQKIVYVSITTSTDEAMLIMIIQILAITGVVAGIGFASYMYAYQTVLKYPKPVRKVRKFRKKLRKKKIKGVDITSRQKSFDELYKKQLGQIEKLIKSKNVELDVHTDEKLDKLLKK